MVAQLERFAQILEPERVLGDLVVPEEVRAAAGREHELVVLQRVAVAEPHDLAAKSTSTTSPSRTRTFGARRKTFRSGAAMSLGLNRQLATWYRSGVNRW